jgi:ribosomal-protein-alanine N-acetyltransferase
LEGRVTGFVVVRRTGPGEHEVLNLAVAPEHRRLGIGTQLLTAAMEEAPGDWFLEVRESNQAAQGLYRRYGFQVAGRRPEYYSDSRESGIVMRLRSC